MKRLFVVAGAVMLGIVGFVGLTPKAEAAPLVCIRLGFGNTATQPLICIPPA